MKILDYIKNLLPQFGKDRLIEDLRICRTELLDITIPSYERSLVVFKEEPTGLGKEFTDYRKTFDTFCKGADRRLSLIENIYIKLEGVVHTLDSLQKIIEANFDSVIATEGLTLRKANALRLLEVCSFVSVYAVRFLNYIYVLETARLNKDQSYVRDNFSLKELELINKGFLEFCVCLETVSRPKKDVEKVLDTIPDVVITAETEAAFSNKTKTDPFSMFGQEKYRAKGFVGNPIYWVGMVVAEFQDTKYKRMQALKATLELRLLNLQMTTEGTNDPAVQREIEMYQSRISKLDEKIRGYEEGIK